MAFNYPNARRDETKVSFRNFCSLSLVNSAGQARKARAGSGVGEAVHDGEATTKLLNPFTSGKVNRMYLVCFIASFHRNGRRSGWTFKYTEMCWFTVVDFPVTASVLERIFREIQIVTSTFISLLYWLSTKVLQNLYRRTICRLL